MAKNSSVGDTSRQGDLSTLDPQTSQDAVDLSKKMGSRETRAARQNWPFIWGSIRILAIYSDWSWWRDPR